MTLAEVIYHESLDLPAEKAQAVINFIGFLKNRYSSTEPVFATATPSDYERARRQALAFLEQPPFMLNGRYGSRDALYDRL